MYHKKLIFNFSINMLRKLHEKKYNLWMFYSCKQNTILGDNIYRNEMIDFEISISLIIICL